MPAPFLRGNKATFCAPLGVVARDATVEGKVQALRPFPFRRPDPALFRFSEAEAWHEVAVVELFQWRA